MKPKYLYHGSSRNISGNTLIPKKAKDTHKKENCENAIYATERRDIAIGMSLTGQKNPHSFADYEKKPVKIIFTRNFPKMKFTYLYKVSSKTFSQNSPHQWVSFEPVKILEKVKLKTKDISKYWRLATQKEKEWFKKATS
jgi:hypothetical protein